MVDKKFDWKSLSYKVNILASIIFITIFVVFFINFMTVDWERVSDDFEGSIETLMDGLQCTIDYKGFHFEGMCADQDEIFDFLREINNVSSKEESKLDWYQVVPKIEYDKVVPIEIPKIEFPSEEWVWVNYTVENFPFPTFYNTTIITTGGYWLVKRWR